MLFFSHPVSGCDVLGTPTLHEAPNQVVMYLPRCVARTLYALRVTSALWLVAFAQHLRTM